MRAQVSVYIIVGIILLAVVGISYNVLKKDVLVDTPAPVEFKGVVTYVEQCLEETAKEGLLTIGLQGGYYDVPLRSISTIYSDIPYYYYMDDVSLVLTPDEMLDELESFIKDEIDGCLNFDSLPGYDVAVEDINVFSKLGDSMVTVELEMPTVITKQDQQTRHEKYSASVNVRLIDYYNIANFITTSTISDPYFIDISQLFYLMGKHEMQIDTLTYDNDVVIYVVQDNNSIINGIPLMFLFGVLVDRWNHAPELYVTDMTADVGVEFYYQVEGYDREGRTLRFWTDSPFFDVNERTGEFGFVPEDNEKGEYFIKFYVSDGIDTTERTVRLVVQ